MDASISTPHSRLPALTTSRLATLAIFLLLSITHLLAQRSSAQHASPSAAAHTYSVETANHPDGFIVTFTNPRSSPPITAYYISYLCPPAKRDAVSPDALLHYGHTPDLIPSNAILDFHLDKPDSSNSCTVETAVLFKDATGSGGKDFLEDMREQRRGARDEIISLKETLSKAAAGTITAPDLSELLDKRKVEILQLSSKSHGNDVQSGRLEVVEFVHDKLQSALKPDGALASHAQDVLKLLDQWQQTLTAGLPSSTRAQNSSGH